MTEFGTAMDLYFGGDMEASLALTGQVAGRIDAVRTAREIVHSTITEFRECISSLAAHA